MSKSGTGQVDLLYYLVPKDSPLYALIDQYRTSILIPFVERAKTFSTHRGISKLDYSVGKHSIAATQAFFFGKRRATSEWVRSPSGEAVIPRPKSSKARSLSVEFHGLKIKTLGNPP